MCILYYSNEYFVRVLVLCFCILDDEKLGNFLMNLEFLRVLYFYYLDILVIVVIKIYIIQSTKKFSDIFSFIFFIKKLFILFQLQVIQYGVEQVFDEGEQQFQVLGLYR